MSSSLQDLNNLVSEIKVNWTVLPPVDLKDPFSPQAAPGPGHTLLEVLKPQITIVPRDANIAPIVSAPFGTPTNHWPIVKVVGGTLLAYAIGRLVLPKLLPF